MACLLFDEKTKVPNLRLSSGQAAFDNFQMIKQ